MMITYPKERCEYELARIEEFVSEAKHELENNQAALEYFKNNERETPELDYENEVEEWQNAIERLEIRRTEWTRYLSDAIKRLTALP